MLRQITHRISLGDNLAVPVSVPRLNGAAPYRFLRGHCALSDTGVNGALPCLRHIGGGGEVLGEWLGTVPSGGAFPASVPLKVTISTASPPVLTTSSAVEGQNDATTYFSSVAIPPDLVILENERLEFCFLLATAPGSGASIAGSDLFLTIAADS